MRPEQFWGPTIFLFNNRNLIPRVKRPRLTTHLNLVPMLKISGGTQLRHLYGFKGWTETTLSFKVVMLRLDVLCWVQKSPRWTVGVSIPVGTRFFALVLTGPGAHPASCTMGTGSFPGVKRPGRGAEHPPPSSAEVENE
jgi:hypothetical protein